MDAWAQGGGSDRRLENITQGGASQFITPENTYDYIKSRKTDM
jgi:hypothetical protein